MKLPARTFLVSYRKYTEPLLEGVEGKVKLGFQTLPKNGIKKAKIPIIGLPMTAWDRFSATERPTSGLPTSLESRDVDLFSAGNPAPVTCYNSICYE